MEKRKEMAAEEQEEQETTTVELSKEVRKFSRNFHTHTGHRQIISTF